MAKPKWKIEVSEVVPTHCYIQKSKAADAGEYFIVKLLMPDSWQQYTAQGAALRKRLFAAVLAEIEKIEAES